MTNASLIIALVFATLFGCVAVWLVLYFTHRYIHERCLEFALWFHRITAPTTCCQHEEVHIELKERSRGARDDKTRGRSGRNKYRERDIEDNRFEDVGAGWPRNAPMGRSIPRLQMGAFPPGQQYGQQTYLPRGWQGQVAPMVQMAYPQAAMFPQMPLQQGNAMMPPVAMPSRTPQVVFAQTPAAIPTPTHHRRPPQQPYAETSSDASKATPRHQQSEKPKPRPKRASHVNEVDYIHICDEYPPIVLEAMKKAAPPPSSVSSSSSASSDTTQEVPRVSIPRARPRFADPVSFEIPEYPQLGGRGKGV